jgi:hypothetical protein
MVEYQYYLHFKITPPQSVLDRVLAQCTGYHQVYESSYFLTSYLSFGNMNRLVSLPPPTQNYYLCRITQGMETASSDEAD